MGSTFNKYDYVTVRAGAFHTDGRGDRRYDDRYIAKWDYKPYIANNGGPHTVYNPQRYDRRSSSIVEIFPDIFSYTERDGDNVVQSTTVTSYADNPYPRESVAEPEPGWAQNLYDKSITVALLKLRDNRIEMGENAAQAKQSLNMAATTVLQLGQAIKALYQKRYNDIPGILGMSWKDVLWGKFPANKWLEYQYGWKPLMGDIYTALKRAQSELQKPADMFHVFGTGRDYAEWEYHSNGFRRMVKSRFIARTHLYYRIKNQTVSDIDSYGLLNPLALGWQLYPFSFVLDWFIPVGSVLQALSATAGLEFGAGFTTRKYVIKTASERDPPLADVYPGYSITSSASSRTYSDGFARDPFYSFPLPRLYTNNHPFSTPHIVSAIALIRGLFR